MSSEHPSELSVKSSRALRLNKNLLYSTNATPTSYKQSKKKVKKFLEKGKISAYLCPPRKRDVLINY
jgi:hypothetical protein